MTHPDDLSGKRFPWLRSGFDLEGYVGALAAWLVGILLSIFFSPLFWIGFIAAVIILFATRTAERSPPDSEDVMVAPCDGIVASIGGATPPDELRLEGQGWTRIRIASAPFTSNGVHAPMGGEIDHIIREGGDRAAIIASKPDTPGLAVAYVALTSGGRSTGLRLATGGFGPRLEIDVETGDAVRMGRTLGSRRLGGWCDIYLPKGCAVKAWVGQTLIGSETILGQFTSGVEDIFEAAPEQSSADTSTPATTAAAEEIAPAAEEVDDSSPEPVLDEADEDKLEALSGENNADDAAEPVDADPTDADLDATDEDEDDVSEMFERLRKEAQKVRDDD